MAPVTGFEGSRTSETSEADLEPSAVTGRPYLLLAGSAAGGLCPAEARLQALDAPLEIGRGRTKARASAGTLALDDRCVSTRHARVEKTIQGFFVTDLGSRNGTLVDGRAVERQRLRDGALLFFGGYAAVFRYLTPEAVAAIEEDMREPFGPVATASPAMALAIRKLRRLAPTADSLLLSGETGTGKEVYARAVHRASARRGKFVALNCAAIPTELVESELFGYARGAHSQAAQSKRGLIEQAEKGTLFLDEIGDMPRAAQAKLLRFLQERELIPLGGSEARPVDVRVVAATAELEDGAQPVLRRDLLMRLGTQPIVLPPLRERPEDMAALASHFLGAPGGFENRAFLALCLHDWPGNVRELEKVLRDAVLFRDGGGPLRLQHLPEGVGARLATPPPSASPGQRRAPRAAPDRAELVGLLERHHGNVADVARQLDRKWSVVWRWIKRHQLDPETYRRPR
jgi:transcriptional regulator with PAS, ATPase and Fis domain